MQKVNNNIKDFIIESLKDNKKTFELLGLIDNGVISPFEVIKTLKE